MSDDKPRAQPNPRARLWVQDLRGGTTETPAVAEPTEPWVTGRPPVAQRVPGIEEAQDATYVEPEPTSWRRAALIGTGIGLVVTAIIGAIIVSADDSGGSSKSAAIGPGVTASSALRQSSTTTSTNPTSATTTAAVAPPATTAPPAALAAAVAPPTPRATSDPAAAPYTDVPLPDGVGATMTNCGWQPTNGGQYEASGTVMNGPSTNHGWTLTIHWLQNGREIATQSAVVDLTAGNSSTWVLTLAAPNPPADPFSCALTAA